jgi:hypothetical protein
MAVLPRIALMCIVRSDVAFGLGALLAPKAAAHYRKSTAALFVTAAGTRSGRRLTSPSSRFHQAFLA